MSSPNTPLSSREHIASSVCDISSRVFPYSKISTSDNGGISASKIIGSLEKTPRRFSARGVVLFKPKQMQYAGFICSANGIAYQIADIASDALCSAHHMRYFEKTSEAFFPFSVSNGQSVLFKVKVMYRSIKFSIIDFDDGNIPLANDEKRRYCSSGGIILIPAFCSSRIVWASDFIVVILV